MTTAHGWLDPPNETAHVHDVPPAPERDAGCRWACTCGTTLVVTRRGQVYMWDEWKPRPQDTRRPDRDNQQ